MANNKPILILFIILMIIGALKVMESIFGITIIHFPLLTRSTKSKETSPPIKVAAATTETPIPQSCRHEIHPDSIPHLPKWNAWCEKIKDELATVKPYLVIQRRSVFVCDSFDSGQLLEPMTWCKSNINFRTTSGRREDWYRYTFAYYWFDNSIRKNTGHRFANFIPESTKVWAWNQWCNECCTSDDEGFPRAKTGKHFTVGYHSAINAQRKYGGAAIDAAITDNVEFLTNGRVNTACTCKENDNEESVDIANDLFSYDWYSKKMTDVYTRADADVAFAKYIG